MATMPLTPARGKAGSGGGLGKKVGGLPVWVWALAGVAAVGIGLYLRNKLSGSASRSTPASTAVPVDTSGAGSGGSSGGDTSSLDAATQASEDLAGALNGLTAILGSGSFVGPPVATGATGAAGPAATGTTAPTVLRQTSTPVSGAKTTITDAFGNTYAPVPASAGGGYVVGGVYIPGSIAGQPLTTAQIEAYTPPPGEIAQHYPPQQVPPAPVSTATNHPPAPSTAPKPSATSAGQTAVNERPTVTPHGRAV